MEIGGYSDSYSIPKLDDMLDMLSGARIFSKMEIMNEEGHYLKTMEGLYEWLVLPVGICKAAGALITLTSQVFEPFIGKFVVVYCTDILIFSKDADTHLEHMAAVLQLLRENHLRANPNKTTFGANKLEFMGFIVSANGIQVDPMKVHAITNWPIPKTSADIKSFHGLVSYFKRFIKNFSVIMAPIAECLKSDSYTWNSLAEESFKEIKNKISRAPILALPDFSKTFRVDFDATVVGVWAVLSQEGHLIAYFSELLDRSKENYSVYDLKFYAIVQALKFWKNYLIQKEFILRIDDELLCFHNSRKNWDGMHAKWATFLQEYKIQMSFKAGSQNITCDRTDQVGNQEKKMNGSVLQVKEVAAEEEFMKIDPNQSKAMKNQTCT